MIISGWIFWQNKRRTKISRKMGIITVIKLLNCICVSKTIYKTNEPSLQQWDAAAMHKRRVHMHIHDRVCKHLHNLCACRYKVGVSPSIMVTLICFYLHWQPSPPPTTAPDDPYNLYLLDPPPSCPVLPWLPASQNVPRENTRRFYQNCCEALLLLSKWKATGWVED